MADSTPKRLILGTLFVQPAHALESHKKRLLRIWIVFDKLYAKLNGRDALVPKKLKNIV